MKLSLLNKYDQPTPRYTSYPTVPYWEQAPDQEHWLGQLQDRLSQHPEVSLYIHLPYCEQLCTYCGCNKRITVNHAVERPYIDSLLQEWAIYQTAFRRRPVLKELHLGGGTPTFFSPENLDYLLQEITRSVSIPEDRSFGFEAHPNNTMEAHLAVLHKNHFNRISIGVQDFSPVIMTAINRRQDERDVYRLTGTARKMGFDSINFDFVYGLPFQRMQHIQYNLEKLAELRPERVAYYSYAHVPWKQASQRRFTEADIPVGVDKRALYETIEQGLRQLGYHSIGIDHFSLPSDELYQSAEAGSLHRNFMGYTPYSTNFLIGLGASAIGDSGTAFIQNAPKVEEYQQDVAEGRLPIIRGHQLSEADQRLRGHILNLMCRFFTYWLDEEWTLSAELQAACHRLEELARDGLVKLNRNSVHVTPAGLPFIRNIANCFDARYWERQPTQHLFSSTL